MKRAPSIAGIISVVLLAAGCGGLKLAIDDTGTYERTLGTATPNDIVRSVPDIFRSRYSMDMHRVMYDEQSNNTYVETSWRNLVPASDDKGDITSRRIRYIVEGRARARRGPEAVQLNVVTLTAQKEVRRSGEGSWVRAEFTESETIEVEEIVDYLKDRLTTGVRTY